MRAREQLGLFVGLKILAGWAQAGKADDPFVANMRELLQHLEMEANG